MKKWHSVLLEIFPSGIPNFCIWTNKEAIINVLKRLGSFKNSNHLFYPDGGGSDLVDSARSFENNCIEIDTGFNEILSPKSLTFHSFDDLEWSYFRIELNELKAYNANNNHNNKAEFYEELCEIAPSKYISREYWDENEYEDKPLPQNARLIARRLQGAIVIFGKSSKYNANNLTYDGRHNMYSDKNFRKYVETIQKKGWES